LDCEFTRFQLFKTKAFFGNAELEIGELLPEAIEVQVHGRRKQCH
jgi:hypothetical protein